jgi:hypothetical protein
MSDRDVTKAVLESFQLQLAAVRHEARGQLDAAQLRLVRILQQLDRGEPVGCSEITLISETLSSLSRTLDAMRVLAPLPKVPTRINLAEIIGSAAVALRSAFEEFDIKLETSGLDVEIETYPDAVRLAFGTLMAGSVARLRRARNPTPTLRVQVFCGLILDADCYEITYTEIAGAQERAGPHCYEREIITKLARALGGSVATTTTSPQTVTIMLPVRLREAGPV